MDHLTSLPAAAPVDDATTPGNATFSAPTTCHACGAALRWTPPALYTHCPVCQLSAYPHPRSLPAAVAPADTLPASLMGEQAVTPMDITHAIAFTSALTAVECGYPDGVSSLLLRQRPLVVDDYRWATLRQHPTQPDAVIVCRYDVAIAVVHRRLAAWWRCVLLRRWSGANVSSAVVRCHEGDVAAGVIAWLLALHRLPPASWALAARRLGRPPSDFPGDHHVFMAVDLLLEAPTCRFACLPSFSGPLPPGHPAHSAYTELHTVTATDRQSPLNAEAYRRLFVGHPLHAYMVNSIRVGFSLFAASMPIPPPRTVSAATTQRGPGPTPDQLLAMPPTAVAEFELGGFVDASTWTTVHTQPWFALPKDDGGQRGIANLSDGGVDSVNAHIIRPRSLLGAIRFASFKRIARRICYLKRTQPGASVVIFKTDKRRAFRQLALPYRERWMTGHAFLGDVVAVHSRVPMGARSALEIQCSVSWAAADLAARQWGLSLEVYVDDDTATVLAQDATDAETRVFGLARALGWEIHMGKYAADGFPAEVKDVLGVRFDTVNCTASVTPRRAARLAEMLGHLLSGTPASPVFTSARDLSSLTGKLAFVATVIPFGKLFLRSLYHATAAATASLDDRHELRLGRRRHSHTSLASSPAISVTGDVLRDLQWWRSALVELNGAASFGESAQTHVVRVATDASKHGYGMLCFTTSEYSGGRWRANEQQLGSTAHWEAAAVVFAAATWSSVATGGVMELQSDSMATVLCVDRLHALDHRMHTLLTLLCVIQLRSRFRLRLSHVRGVDNAGPDAVSRGKPLPPMYVNFSRVTVPPSIRGRGINSPPLWATPLSPVAAPLDAPASTTGTDSRLSEVYCAPTATPFPWQIWSEPPRTPAASCSSSSAGCSTPSPTSPVTPSPTTARELELTLAASWDKHHHPRPCMSGFCFDSAKCPQSSCLASQSPCLSSETLWLTSPRH